MAGDRMNDHSTDVFVDHVGHSVGGMGGHAFRRLTHVSMASIPYLYYVHGERISSYFSLQAREFVSAICILILVTELVRLRTGIVIVGQREYESSQISALAWGALAVALAILVAPEGENGTMEAGKYGAPIILGMTLVSHCSHSIPPSGPYTIGKQNLCLVLGVYCIFHRACLQRFDIRRSPLSG